MRRGRIVLAVGRAFKTDGIFANKWPGDDAADGQGLQNILGHHADISQALETKILLMSGNLKN